MKAHRRHELRENDLVHYLYQSRDYLRKNGATLGIGISVVIIADRAAEVGRAVEVMDNCMLAGATKISIAASKEGQF